MEKLNDIYIHDLQPFAIQFTETIGVRWYGLAYLSGFLIGYFMIVWMAKRKKSPLTVEQVGDFVTHVAIGTMVGGRLGYCLFYSPELFLQFGGAFPFWGVLEVHKGGMASHGGIMGVMVGCWIFARKYKVNLLHLIDLTCFGGGLGIFFGRIANYINGELYGRAVVEPIAWAVKFPQEIFFWASNKPQELLKLGPAVEALGPINIAGKAHDIDASTWVSWVERFQEWKFQKVMYYLDALTSAVEKGNQDVIAAIGPALTARHPSQIYQALMEGLFVVIVLSIVWLKPRKPGIIAGCFGIVYAIMRVLGEAFRMPDAHIGYQWLGLTRGQILSFFMLVFSLGYLVYSLKKKDQPLLGGFNTKKNAES